MSKKILITDPTLRDGNHAVGHKLNSESYAAYCAAAEAAGVPIVEVGHGNGLGGSSMLVGEGRLCDQEILNIARQNLSNSRLAIHVIPGFCTIKKDLSKAVGLGVDVFRIAAHCTEADVTERHMKYIRQANKEAWGILMMSHMATPEILLEEAKKMESYGAQAIVIMDSAGAQLVDDVRARIATLVNGLSIPVGFHGHNNLGMALVNSITAVQEGATILDGTIRGFGAGAGNTQLEVLVGVLHKLGFETGIDLFKILDAASMAEKELNFVAPTISAISLVSGLAGVFSGFAKPVARAAIEYGVDPREIFFNLGKRKAVAGQESLIIEVARELKRDR
ncbi:4-hydroxy-2-oxovalerate aldolase [Pseudomonas sp. CF161]|uniref:4-hydroxy-2-oxovalerate aldolase n=1 Tax=Pseudomonas sp. CF161 TaxID=911241 RepID=UPI0005BAEB5F|nr:4-hydroxy-2-oxovalerate aldolase [Pseudomonas sp. CF161]